MHSGCDEDEFPCDVDKCIPMTQVCDNNTDCEDGTDESHPDCIRK